LLRASFSAAVRALSAASRFASWERKTAARASRSFCSYSAVRFGGSDVGARFLDGALGLAAPLGEHAAAALVVAV
jgi:hypothetical protein